MFNVKKKLKIENNHARPGRRREFYLKEKQGRVAKSLRTPGVEYKHDCPLYLSSINFKYLNIFNVNWHFTELITPDQL